MSLFGRTKPPTTPEPLTLVVGMPPLELARLVRDRLQHARGYGSRHLRDWRVAASGTRVVTLLLSLLATIFVGLSDPHGLAAAGFVCAAVVTAFNVLEPFFNWRSRQVLAEEAVDAWYRIEEDLVNYVSSTVDLDVARLLALDAERQAVWRRFSEGWLRARRSHAPESAA